MTNVLIMAGGRGLRLHPITAKTPKSMLRVGSKPIIRSIVDEFVRQGFRDIWLSLGYKAELIKDYFDTNECGANIRYIVEDTPRGTGGPLVDMPQDKPTIVSNADVITRMDYQDLMAHHLNARCLATMCVALHQQQVHFGVVNAERGRMVEIREKPIESFQVNAGIYVIEPGALVWANSDAFPITDLLAALPQGEVSVYEIEDYWLDIGRFEDLGRAVALAAE